MVLLFFFNSIVLFMLHPLDQNQNQNQIQLDYGTILGTDLDTDRCPIECIWMYLTWPNHLQSYFHSFFIFIFGMLFWNHCLRQAPVTWLNVINASHMNWHGSNTLWSHSLVSTWFWHNCRESGYANLKFYCYASNWIRIWVT